MRSSFWHSFLRPRILLTCVLLLLPAAATGQITITEDAPADSQDAVKIGFTLAGAFATAGKVRVKLDGPVDAVTSKEIQQPAGGEYIISVRVFKGANTIKVIGFSGAGPSVLKQWPVNCAGRWCSDPFTLTADSVAVPGAAPAAAPAAAVAAAASGIAIQSPTADTTFQDETFIRSAIKVTKPAIKKVFVRVLNGGKPVPQRQDIYPVETAAGA